MNSGGPLSGRRFRMHLALMRLLNDCDALGAAYKVKQTFFT